RNITNQVGQRIYWKARRALEGCTALTAIYMVKILNLVRGIP
ncbi:13629_t:CDS:1, partial [Rhizophagus irregularis]